MITSRLIRCCCVVLAAASLALRTYAVEASPPLALQSTMVALTYRTVSHWPTGFVGEVAISNSGSQPIDLWRVEVGLDATVLSSWGARLVESGPGRLVFGYETWDKIIPAGQTVRFGFLTSTPLLDTAPPVLALKDVNDDIATADAGWQQWVSQQEFLSVQQSWSELMVFTFTRFESLTPARTGYDLIEKDPVEQYLHRRFERVRLQTIDGLIIKGVFLPVSPAKGTVILLHGHGNTYFETLPLAQLLAERGYQVLAYNSREWNFYRTPQDYTNDIRNDAADLSAAVGYLKGRHDVDSRRIGVMGYSYGSSKALLAAPSAPDVKVVIVEGANSHVPTLNPGITWEMVKDDFIARYTARLHFDPADFRENLRLIAQLSPRAALVIHGQNDPLVPLTEGQELYTAAGSPKTLLILPHSGHIDALTTEDRELYLNGLVRFLDLSLAPAAR